MSKIWATVEAEIKKALQENYDRQMNSSMMDLTPDQLSRMICSRLRDKFGGMSVYIEKPWH